MERFSCVNGPLMRSASLAADVCIIRILSKIVGFTGKLLRWGYSGTDTILSTS